MTAPTPTPTLLLRPALPTASAGPTATAVPQVIVNVPPASHDKGLDPGTAALLAVVLTALFGLGVQALQRRWKRQDDRIASDRAEAAADRAARAARGAAAAEQILDLLDMMGIVPPEQRGKDGALSEPTMLRYLTDLRRQIVHITDVGARARLTRATEILHWTDMTGPWTNRSPANVEATIAAEMREVVAAYLAGEPAADPKAWYSDLDSDLEAYEEYVNQQVEEDQRGDA